MHLTVKKGEESQRASTAQLRKPWGDWNCVSATQRNGGLKLSLSLVIGSHISCTLEFVD